MKKIIPLFFVVIALLMLTTASHAGDEWAVFEVEDTSNTSEKYIWIKCESAEEAENIAEKINSADQTMFRIKEGWLNWNEVEFSLSEGSAEPDKISTRDKPNRVKITLDMDNEGASEAYHKSRTALREYKEVKICIKK
ncbi:hypothetical protein ACFL24_00500 [Patescibacteria group bacterium]